MKLYIRIAYHYNPEKLRFLEMVLDSLDKIHIPKSVYIDTNMISDFSLKYLHERINFPIYRHTLEDPFLLTWVHKQYLDEFLRSDYTHFIYLEDDIRITEKTIDYWTEKRDLFKRNSTNFVPGVFRIEYLGMVPISLDFTHPVSASSDNIVIIEGQRFLSPIEPYQGMFIMDKELVEEHIESGYTKSDIQVNQFGLREAANSAYLFYNVPEGYFSRCLLPIQNFTDCWVWHTNNNYCLNFSSPHGKLFASRIFSNIVRTDF